MGRKRKLNLDTLPASASAMSGPPRRAAGTAVVDSAPPEPIDPAYRGAVARGVEQSRRRDYASEAEIEASFALFDP